jgi:hypothetical protein
VEFCEGEDGRGFFGAGVQDYVGSGGAYWGCGVVFLDGDVEEVGRWWERL